ncbi:MAG: hypothetical protein ACT4PO_02390 [Actinomycetota bacterium]
MKDATRAEPPGTGAIVAIGFGFTAVFVIVLLVMMGRTTYDTWAAMFIGPFLFLVTLPLLARQAAREGDRRLFWLLVAALICKFAGSLLRAFVAFGVYGGRADAQGFLGAGYHISENFLDGNFDTGLESITGTDFISLLTGIIFTATRTTLLGGFFVYSWLSFIGMFLFYRAFVIAVPEGRSRTYARLLFFLPSMLFWPSSIGKEAWMVFAMGIAAFGIARILTDSPIRGVLLTALGLGLGAMVRPHIPGMMAIALMFGYVFRRSRSRHRELAMAAKVVTLAILGLGAAFLVTETKDFLNAESVTAALEKTAEATSVGGSEFEPANIFSPTGAPIAVFTVLYRPTALDAHNLQALLSALEGTFLLLLSLKRVPWIIAAIRSIRRQPYVVFAAAYMGMFVVAFSSFSNFGLLSRERVQLLPLLFVFLSIPPLKKARAEEDSQADAEGAGLGDGAGSLAAV